MRERLLELIEKIVEELNEDRVEKISTTNLLDVVLYGDAGVLDSLRLVNFLVLVEEAVEDEFGAQISLTSEKAVSRRRSPFARVGWLLDYIEEEFQLEGVETLPGATPGRVQGMG